MTIAKALGLQADVYTAVSGAAGSVPVYDHAPINPPGEYIRLDGFNIANVPMKRGQVARHSFEVHHFVANVTGATTTRGQSRSKTVLAAVHAALMGTTLQGYAPEFEYLNVDTDMDGTTAHGMSRYNVVLV